MVIYVNFRGERASTLLARAMADGLCILPSRHFCTNGRAIVEFEP